MKSVRSFRIRVCLLVALLVTSGMGTGCGLRAVHTTSGQAVTLPADAAIALRGRQVIRAGIAAADGLDALVAAGTVSKPDALVVLGVLDDVGKDGQQLAQSLRTVQDLKPGKERDQKIDASVALLQQIARRITAAPATLKDDRGRLAITTLLQAVVNVVVQVSASVPAKGGGV